MRLHSDAVVPRGRRKHRGAIEGPFIVDKPIDCGPRTQKTAPEGLGSIGATGEADEKARKSCCELP